MNFEQLQLECRSVLQDPTTESSIPTWLNDSMDEIAAQFEIPALRLHKPATIETTDDEWVYPLATSLTPPAGMPDFQFQKKVFRVASESTPLGFVLEVPMMILDDVDFAHSQTGDAVLRVAVEDDTIGIYPMANDTLNVWCYRRPVPMVEDTDTPDGMPKDFAYRVLVPKTVIRALRLFPALLPYGEPGDNRRALATWEARLNQGLFGNGYEIGFVSYLQKQRGITTRGPRLGQNVTGGGWYTRRRIWAIAAMVTSSLLGAIV